jgi:hypothetical protein
VDAIIAVGVKGSVLEKHSDFLLTIDDDPAIAILHVRRLRDKTLRHFLLLVPGRAGKAGSGGYPSPSPARLSPALTKALIRSQKQLY